MRHLAHEYETHGRPAQSLKSVRREENNDNHSVERMAVVDAGIDATLPSASTNEAGRVVSAN